VAVFIVYDTSYWKFSRDGSWCKETSEEKQLNKCSITDESFYATNMQISCNSLLICCDLWFSGRPCRDGYKI